MRARLEDNLLKEAKTKEEAKEKEPLVGKKRKAEKQVEKVEAKVT
jgi:hypothetical protein